MPAATGVCSQCGHNLHVDLEIAAFQGPHIKRTRIVLVVIGVLATQETYSLFLPGLLQGAWLTIQITILGALLAVVMGVLAALARLYGPAPLRWLATVYVEIFRGTSALVQLFWLFFVLPQFGILIDAFSVAVLALDLMALDDPVVAYQRELDALSFLADRLDC